MTAMSKSSTMSDTSQNKEVLRQACLLNDVAVGHLAAGKFTLALTNLENAVKVMMPLEFDIMEECREDGGESKEKEGSKSEPDSSTVNKLSLSAVPLTMASSQEMSQDQQGAGENYYYNHALMLKNYNFNINSSDTAAMYWCISSVTMFNLAQTFQLRGNMTCNPRILANALILYMKTEDFILSSPWQQQKSPCVRCCVAVLIGVFINKAHILQRLGLHEEADRCFENLVEMMRYSNVRPPAFNHDRYIMAYFQLSRMCRTIPKHSAVA